MAAAASRHRWGRRARLIRRSTVAAMLVVLVTPGTALAHGIGGRADLPVPVSYFAVGAGIVIVATFVMLSAMWTEPRLQTPARATGPSRRIARLGVILRGLGLVGLLAVVGAGLLDGTSSGDNVAPVLVFVYFWLVVPFVSAVAGDWWHWMNPWATISRRLNRTRPEREDLVARFGVWPATAAFLAFTWLELVSPDASDPGTLAIAAIVYTGIVLAAGYVAGPRSGLRLIEAFHTYNGVIASIAPLDLVPENGEPAESRAGVARRGWLRALPALPSWPGLWAFVVAMIGTVTYDGLSSTELWRDLFPDVRREVWFGTIALLGVTALVGAMYWLASWSAARIAGAGWTDSRVASRFAHTLVPIGVAYAVAHYITLVLFEGQILFAAVSDPFRRGWDLFGTADWSVNFFLSPEVVWYVQVAAIVAGHVAGVVLAHDRALADFDDEVAVSTQYAMLALMVALTSLGLFILAG